MPETRTPARRKKSKSSSLPFSWEEALEHLSKKDRKLGRIIEKMGPVRLQTEPFQNTFETLAESIIYQQLTGKAAATIAGRFRQLWGSDDWPLPEKVHEASIEHLRKAGLSNSKAAAIKDLARLAVDGDLPSVEELDLMEDDDVIEKLTVIRGVGPWTVQMLLIFRLGRPDVMPSTDYGVRKGFAVTMKRDELPTPKELEAHAERWRPYRSVGSWYMWRALEL